MANSREQDQFHELHENEDVCYSWCRSYAVWNWSELCQLQVILYAKFDI